MTSKLVTVVALLVSHAAVITAFPTRHRTVLLLRGGNVPAGPPAGSPPNGRPPPPNPHSQSQRQRPPPPKPPQPQKSATPQSQPPQPSQSLKPQQEPEKEPSPAVKPAEPLTPCPQPGPNVDQGELEERTGLRLSWHVWPASTADADDMAAPLGLLYAPLRPIKNLQRQPRAPAKCELCSATLNPFAHVEPHARRWHCPMCASWNELPMELAQAATAPAETQPEHATIEYELPDTSTGPAAVLLVLDCALSLEELNKLEEAVQTMLSKLPPDTPVGLITYADGVELHELGHPLGNRLWRLPDDRASEEPEKLLETLGIPDPNAPPPPPPPPAEQQLPPHQLQPSPYGQAPYGQYPPSSYDQQPPPYGHQQQPPPYGYQQQPPPYGDQQASQYGYQQPPTYSQQQPSPYSQQQPPPYSQQQPPPYSQPTSPYDLRGGQGPPPYGQPPPYGYQQQPPPYGDQQPPPYGYQQPPPYGQQPPSTYGQQYPQQQPASAHPGFVSGAMDAAMSGGMFSPAAAAMGHGHALDSAGAGSVSPSPNEAPNLMAIAEATKKRFFVRAADFDFSDAFKARQAMCAPPSVRKAAGGEDGSFFFEADPRGSSADAAAGTGAAPSATPDAPGANPYAAGVGSYATPGAGAGVPGMGGGMPPGPMDGGMSGGHMGYNRGGGHTGYDMGSQMGGGMGSGMAGGMGAGAAYPPSGAAYPPSDPGVQPMWGAELNDPAANWAQPTQPPRGRLAKAAAEAAAKQMQAGVEAGAEEGKRAPRCTGSALAAAETILESCFPDGGARAMVFTGGPAVGGAGAIVGLPLSEQIRSHRDIQNRENGHSARQRAVEFYERIAARAAEKGHSIDLISASLEETGLYEMRSCVHRSGGVALQAETFGADHLRQSLERFFEADDEGELLHGYRATIELRTSKECSAVSLLGAEGGAAGNADVTEAGEARTFSWSIGGFNSHYTAALALTRGSENLAGARDVCLLQISATYKHANGGRRMRVSTLRMPKLTQTIPTRHLLPAFDQQAAAALLVRNAVRQADGGASTSALVSSIDKRLIRVMQALCEYQKADPATVMLPPHAAQLPGLAFHLRRSPAVRIASASPDETAYFRQLTATLGVFATLVLVQPTLLGYQRGSPPTPLPLDPSAMHPERSLLLDTFLKVLLCHGGSIANMRRSEQAQEDTALQQLLEEGSNDVERLSAERFPAPEIFECEQYGSKARYIVQKLNPDVPLNTFLQGLYKAIVA